MEHSNMEYRRTREEDFFEQLVQKFFPYWPLFLLLLAGALVLAKLYSRWVLPAYEINAKLMIKDEKKGVNETQMLEQLNLFRGKKIVENEIEILHSQTFMIDVVRNLGLYAPVYEKKRSRLLPIYQDAPIRIQLRNPDELTEIKPIAFTLNEKDRTVTIENKTYPLNQWTKTPWGDVLFLTNNSKTYTGNGAEYVFRLVRPEKIAAVLLAGLEVTPANKLATVVNLKIKDNIPARGVDILNELISVYTKAEISDKNILAANTISLVENRLADMVGQLDSVENAIESYRTASGIVDISEQGKQYLSNVSEYDRLIEQSKIQIAQFNEVEKLVRNSTAGSGVIPISVGSSDPVFSKLLDNFNEAQQQYERLRKTTGENSPILSTLKEQIEMLKPRIIDNIQTQKANLQLNQNTLALNSRKFTSMLSTIPQKEKQLLEISRQQYIKNQLYTYLLQKREEAVLAYGSTSIGDTRIIDKGRASAEPVSPNKMLLYLAGAIIALVLGLIYVLVKESMSKTVLFRRDVEKMLSRPAISEIVQGRNSRTPHLLDEGKSMMGEQFRSLRNQLLFANHSDHSSRFFVTSLAGNEGKSFVASNLAVCAAQAGKKTVLLDFDFENAKCSMRFNLGHEKGISDFLAGAACLKDVTFECPDQQNLSIIPVGTSRINCSEKLIGGALESILTSLAANFDCIIVCGSSILNDTNMISLTHNTDKTIFVVRQGKTTKENLTMLMDEKLIDEIKEPSFVFNGVRGRGLGIRYYGSVFGYGFNTIPRKLKKA